MDGVVERKARASHLTLTGKKEIDHRHKQKIEKAYVLQRMMQSEKQTKVNQNE